MIFSSPPQWGGEAGRGGVRNAVESENAGRPAPAPGCDGRRTDTLARERVVPWKFRRQHPIGRRIADFACPARKLVIELDGGQHNAGGVADDERSDELARHGYRVIRFWNSEVVENIQGVIEMIRRELEKPA